MYTGIDIGSRYIRAVEVDARGEKVTLLRASFTSTPEGSIEEGRIKYLDKLAIALDNFLKNGHFVAEKVAMSIFNPLVLVRKTRIPSMPDGQIKRTLLWEAKSLLAFPIEEATLEYQVLSTIAGEPPQIDVIFVIVPASMVEERVNLAEKLGLELVALDIEPFALQRALIDFSPTRKTETLGLLHTGGSYSTMVIVEKGEFALTRALPATKERKEEDRERLMREVRRFLDFYRAQYREEHEIKENTVARLLISGSRQDIGDFAEFLSKSIGITCEVASPDKELLSERSNESALDTLFSSFPLLVVAYGLALREKAAILEGVIE
ncbi:pilus assembly protein PilM [bacterium]|nr:pilus assembly protein PilM [bacterium]